VHDKHKELLLQQRTQIEQEANRRIQAVAAASQARLSVLQSKIGSAHRSGNIGLMTQLQNEAAAILDTNTAQANEINNAAQAAYEANTQALMDQQAFQAVAEFTQPNGDPSRMIQIMDMYGFPIRLRDAGDGKFTVIRVTGNGQGTTDNIPYTKTEIIQQFQGLISEQARQQQAAQAADTAKFYQDLAKIDAEAARDIKIEMAKSFLKGQENEFKYQTNDAGQIVGMPVYVGDGSYYIVYDPDPPEQAPGLPGNKLTIVPITK